MPWGHVAYKDGLPQVLVISHDGHVSLKLSVPVLFVNASLSISLIVLSLFVLFCCLTENGLMKFPPSNTWKNCLVFLMFSFFF